jgi:hypothetical protein
MKSPNKIPRENLDPVDRGDNEEIENVDGEINIAEEIQERKHHQHQEGVED